MSKVCMGSRETIKPKKNRTEYLWCLGPLDINPNKQQVPANLIEKYFEV